MSSEKKKAATNLIQSGSPRYESTSVARLAAGIKKILCFHRQMGIDSYPLTAALRQSLQQSTSGQQPANPSPVVSRESPAGEPALAAEPVLAVEARVDRLRILQGEVESCARCALAEVGQGRCHTDVTTAMPPLLVVGDYCALDAEVSQSCCFGSAEDVMLWNMMRAIGLAPEQVFVTNVIQCRLPAPQLPDAESPKQCRTFLHREIDLVRPRIICAMGEMATHALLGDQTTFLQSRGRQHQFRCSDDRLGTIPVIVTFHPRFLHRHPDLKKAAWKDLQRVQKYLFST